MVRDPSLDFFAYVSRSKVQQLHEQLGAFTASEWSERRALAGKGEIDAGAGALFGFLKAGLRASGSRTVEVEKRGSQSTVQMLREVLAHIETHKKILDLNELCKKRAGERLDAFAYTYEGNFNVQAEFGPRKRK